MPDTQLSNPSGNAGELFSTAQVIEEYVYDPTVTSTTVLNNGNVVILYGWYNPAAGTTSATAAAAGTYPVVRKATTTAAFTNIGVVVNAPTGGYVPGQVVQVVTKGLAYVTMDANNTTAGHLMLAGATTAGAATDSATALAGKQIGVCLVSTTISSGTANVYGYVSLA